MTTNYLKQWQEMTEEEQRDFLAVNVCEWVVFPEVHFFNTTLWWSDVIKNKVEVKVKKDSFNPHEDLNHLQMILDVVMKDDKFNAQFIVETIKIVEKIPKELVMIEPRILGQVTARIMSYQKSTPQQKLEAIYIAYRTIYG